MVAAAVGVSEVTDDYDAERSRSPVRFVEATISRTPLLEPVPTIAAAPAPLTPAEPEPPAPPALRQDPVAGDVGAIICSYPWPCGAATAVVCAESGFSPTASNPSGARGLFELMPVHAWRFERRGWDYWTDWGDPEKNTAIAYELWAEQGWTPWLSSWPWSC